MQNQSVLTPSIWSPSMCRYLLIGTVCVTDNVCVFFSYSNYIQHKCGKKCFESSYKNISLYLTISILFMILCTSTLIVFKFRNCKLLYYTVRNKYKQLQYLSSNPFQSTIVVHVFYCYMYIHRRWLTIILVNGNLTIC